MENHNYPLFFNPQQFINSVNNNNNNNTIFENMYGNGTTSTPNHQEYMKNEEDVTSYKESIVMEPENSNNSNEKDENKKVKGDKKVRRQRFAFQTRSQVDILDDGYRWRKYGQKAVKNNNFPRSYYRCTHQGCNVKKQVQRLSKDEGVVVTTYEGVHTHPIQKSNDNFEHILNQMQIYSAF